MKFISIDSSLANTGVAVGTVDKDGAITITEIHLVSTKKTDNKQIRASSDTISRCRETFEFVQTHIDRVKPHAVFAETPSGSQSSSGMKSYGSTCMLIAALSPPPFEVTPQEVKLASFGKATASKKDMMNWAEALHPDLEWDKNKNGTLKNKNEHMADAIAIAYTAVKTAEFKRILATL